MRFYKEGTILVDGLKPLIYVELDPTSDEDLVNDFDDNNVGVIEFYTAWWAIEMKEDEEEW